MLYNVCLCKQLLAFVNNHALLARAGAREKLFFGFVEAPFINPIYTPFNLNKSYDFTAPLLHKMFLSMSG